MEASHQPCLFVTSSGRTGTRFFGTLSRQIIQDCVSLHEPDVMTKNEWSDWWFVIRRFGLLSSTIGKTTSQGSLRALGVSRVRGQVSDDDAIQTLREKRNRFMENSGGRFYCEANQQLLLLSDLLPQAFPNSHTVYVVRDPRDWVRSCMSIRSGWYTKRDFTVLFPNGKLLPKYLAHPSEQLDWQAMSRFEKLSWAWNAYNGFAFAKLRHQERVHIYRFEDLFESSAAESNLTNLLQRVTQFPLGEQASWSLPPGMLQRKVHGATLDHPHWTEWPDEHCQQLDDHCGELMRQFGYGLEPAWTDKVAATC